MENARIVWNFLETVLMWGALMNGDQLRLFWQIWKLQQFQMS